MTCLFTTNTLSHMIPYVLTISTNSGVDYSKSSFRMRALPHVEIVSPLTDLVIQGRVQIIDLTISNLEYLSDSLVCIVTLVGNQEVYSYPARQASSNTV